MKRIAFMALACLSLISGHVLSAEVKTTSLKTTAVEAREILPESALSLPYGSSRLSIVTQYTLGLGKTFELGTNILGDIFGFFNLAGGYNFFQNEILAFKALITATYLETYLKIDKDVHGFSLFSPELRSTFFINPRWHQHIQVSFNKIETESKNISLHIGLSPSDKDEKITPSKSVHFKTISEFRLFKNKKYSSSILAHIGDIYKLDNGSLAFGAGAGYLWAWDAFHLHAGINYESNMSSKLGTGHIIPNVGLYWTF